MEQAVTRLHESQWMCGDIGNSSTTLWNIRLLNSVRFTQYFDEAFETQYIVMFVIIEEWNYVWKNEPDNVAYYCRGKLLLQEQFA